MDINLKKRGSGADLTVNELSLATDNSSVVLENLKGYADYTYDETKPQDEQFELKFAQFDEATVKATIPSYTFIGQLTVPAYAVNSSLKETDKKFNNSGKVPSHIVFDGNITNTENRAQLGGLLDVALKNAKTIKNDDDPQIVAAFRGMIKRPQYQDMILTIGYDSFSETPKHLFTFSYAYDETRINGTGSFDQDMNDGSIVLTSHNGLKATIKVADGKVVYGEQSSISKDGRKIGQLELRNKVPVIKYTDGTFESLP
jgi:hypothetical protein